MFLRELADVLPGADGGADVAGVAGSAAAPGEGPAGGGHGAGVLHLVGLEGVEGEEAGGVTGDGLSAVQGLAQAVVQTDLQGLHLYVGGPAGACVVFNLLIVAQGAQEHFQEGIAAEPLVGLEGAVGVAGDDAVVDAPAHVAGIGVVGGHVGKAGGAAGHLVGDGGGEHHVADNLRRGAAGEVVLRLEGAVAVAADDFQGGHNVHSLLVLDAGAVSEVCGAGSGGGEGDKRHRHRQGKSQGKRFFHTEASFGICGITPDRIIANSRADCKRFSVFCRFWERLTNRNPPRRRVPVNVSKPPVHNGQGASRAVRLIFHIRHVATCRS